MDQIQTHPSNAAQAKAFTAPGSLSFPSAGELTPPRDSDKVMRPGGVPNGMSNGMNGMAHLPQGANGQTNGAGVTPATPAATPGAGPGGSGLLPTLQYVSFPATVDALT